jgi:hypothetical protein
VSTLARLASKYCRPTFERAYLVVIVLYVPNSPHSSIDLDISRVEVDLFGPHYDLLRHPPFAGEHHRRRRQTSMAGAVQLFRAHDRNVDRLVRTHGRLEVPGACFSCHVPARLIVP